MGKCAIILGLACLWAANAFAQNVLTVNNDNSRTSANLTETVLSPATVQPGAFGKLFSLSVDGQIYAQPLYQQNVSISGQGTHNVIFIATLHNSVFAFDADTPSTPLWYVNLGPSVPSTSYTSDTGVFTDITPENGILSTPVIDASTGTLYVVAATLENGRFFYRLHALDTGSGAERFGGPTVISAQVIGIGDGSVNASVAFDAAWHLQRPGLLLANGMIYISFGSHGDAVPYHGWMMAYSAQNVQHLVSVFNATPNGTAGAIWQSGRGPAADDAGNIYTVSSNGDTDENTSFSSNVLRLDPTTLAVADWFAPFNFQFLNDTDDDLGAAGALLVPGTNYLITGGKQGVLYLLDKTNLAHVAGNDGQILQSLNTNNFGIFNMALWNRSDGPLLYLHTANSPITAYRLQSGQLTPNPVAQSLAGFNVPFQGMSVSASGSTAGSGVLWVMAPESYPLPSTAVLHAYNADGLAELWNSDMVSTDAPGAFVKFANPTIANGKVYAPAGSGQLAVYGLTAHTVPAQAPVLTGVANAASYAEGPLAPGEIVALLGQNLGPQTLVTAALDQNDDIASQLGGSQVTFNGVAAPLIYTSAGAVGAVVPYEVANASAINVSVISNGQSSNAVTLPGAAAAPGLFSADSTGSGPGAILNSDYSLNSPANPAAAGSIVVIYATGGGQTNPAAATGSLTTNAASLAVDVTVTAGGTPCTVLYAGNAGGEVAGLVQLNVRLPAGVTGNVPVVLQAGGQASQATVTVSIQ